MTEEWIVLKLHTWDLQYPDLGFYVKMKYFKAHLMVSSRVFESKVFRMAIQFEYFSDKEAKWRI